MVLGRPDVWPVGDIALAASVGDVKGLGYRPDAAEMAKLGDAWRPWRSVAARLFWLEYLARRGRVSQTFDVPSPLTRARTETGLAQPG
jgi:DNA-3-methyladenine glycosylase II